MAKSKRLSEVIDAECLGDGRAALDAFKDLRTLDESYPEVADAVRVDADLRHMRDQEVLERIARPYLEGKLAQEGQQQRG